jgi:hypothetical protein
VQDTVVGEVGVDPTGDSGWLTTSYSMWVPVKLVDSLYALSTPFIDQLKITLGQLKFLELSVKSSEF